jgi:hypothetical protein
MRRLALALCLVCTTFGGLGASAASADPVNNPNALLFHVTCSGIPAFDVIGQGAAGHVVGSNSIAVLQAGTFTVFVNGVQTSQSTQSYSGQGSTVSCSAVAEFTAGVDTIRIEITDALIHLTPANG